jgi:transcriptional regulator with XRE-family HTH domain
MTDKPHNDSANEFADRSGISRRQVQRYVKGDAPIPVYVARLLQLEEVLVALRELWMRPEEVITKQEIFAIITRL